MRKILFRSPCSSHFIIEVNMKKYTVRHAQSQKVYWPQIYFERTSEDPAPKHEQIRKKEWGTRKVCEQRR